jgi:hypothetical protein
MITSPTPRQRRNAARYALSHNDFRTRILAWRRRATPALALLLAAAALPSTGSGQTPGQSIVAIGEDATTVPRGMLRLRIVPTWTYTVDEWTTPGGVRRLAPLGGELAADSLGVRELPALEPSETLVRQRSGQSAFQLNLGRSVAAASTRTVVTPLTLELGLSSRLTLGVTVPIVETRTRFGFALNNDTTSRFNSGVNPALSLASARAQN